MDEHANHRLVPPRDLNASERALIESLVAPIDSYRDAIRCQIAHLQVTEQCDTCQSLALAVEEGACPPVAVDLAVLSEGEVRGPAPDELLSLLLHLRNGYINMLEVYRPAGGPITALPVPAQVEVIPGIT